MGLPLKIYRAASWILQKFHKEDFIHEILDERPDLIGKKISKPEQGIMGQTVFIGDEVFKKPIWNAPSLSYCFNKDAEYLKQLKGKEIPYIPELTYVGKNNCFYGTVKIAGEPLTKHLQNLTKEEKDILAGDIADTIINISNKLPKKKGKFAKHADLRPDNILIDPESKKLTGIIDFDLMEYREKEKLGHTSFWVKWFYHKSDLPEIIEQKYNEKTGSDYRKPKRKALTILNASSA